MPATDADNSQFKFLITCIKHCASPGKIDFDGVAEELGIVSKGAAHKRYERMLRAHGIGTGGGTPAPNTPTKKGAKSAATKKESASTAKDTKKRKSAGAAEEDDEDELGDVKPPFKKERLVKGGQDDDMGEI